MANWNSETVVGSIWKEAAEYLQTTGIYKALFNMYDESEKTLRQCQTRPKFRALVQVSRVKRGEPKPNCACFRKSRRTTSCAWRTCW